MKAGIDPAEITILNATTPGRINFWRGENEPATTMAGAMPVNDATNGLFSTATIMNYDVVILPCEGTNDYAKTETSSDCCADGRHGSAAILWARGVQEKAPLFMPFDLSSCVQSHSQPPAPPIS